MSPPEGKAYEVREVHGKGLGLFAIKKILKGARILSESPLFQVPRSARATSKQGLRTSLSKKTSELNPEQRQAFFALHNAFEDEATRELGIVRTNALPLGSNATEGAIFLEASRINHACMQNAQNTWNEDLQKLTIHAIRDIDKDEEITIIYLHNRENRSARQLALQRGFRFTCTCQLCSLPEPQLGLSNACLDEIVRLDASIGDWTQFTTAPLQALQDVRKLLRLCKEEGIVDASIPRAYYDAFQIATYHSDMARATVFVTRAATTRAVMEGDDSPAVRRHRDLARNPFQHPVSGSSPRWKTSANDVPTGLSAEEFEAWLWRDERNRVVAPAQSSSQEAGKHADLRNDSMFPCFDELPGENDLDLNFLESTDGFTYRPRKHWCFLAEIVHIENFFRLRLIVKDKAGQQVPVAFYTSDSGREIGHRQLEKGFTVAVLYGEQHGFLDMTVGIRHENPTSLKIFPVSLEGLFRLSDRVQQYAAAGAEGERTCQACGRKVKTLLKCARCTLFWYCDKTCQTRAWKEKGHKGDCKLLKDPDLRGLFQLPQDGFTKEYQFSMG